MSKLYIQPYNDEGSLVKRGIITVSKQATRLQIAKRVYQSIHREGVTNIRSVDVVDRNNVLFYAFDQRNNELVQTDGEGCDKFENSVFPFETLKQPYGDPGASEMSDEANEKELKSASQKAEREAAKLAKEQERDAAKAEREAAKAAKEQEREDAKAARETEKAEKIAAKEQEKADREAAKEAKKAEQEAAKANKAPSKKDRVLAMIQDGGTTIEAISKELEVSDTAARSLIADVKRMGHTVVGTKDETTKVSTFTLSAA